MGGYADRPVVARGAARIVEYARAANGSYPAKEFVDSRPARDQRRLAVLFQRLADTGKINNREQFKRLSGKIWEFKRGQIRVACFQVKDRWRLTNGVIKKSDKWKKSDIERARRIMTEDLDRK